MDYYILQFMRNKLKKKVWFLALITVNQHVHAQSGLCQLLLLKKLRNKHVAVLKYASPMFKKV